MASIESYLDRICARLSTNPAVAEDVRRELRAHLEDLVEHYCAQGMTRPEAAERAIAWLGEAERVRTGLGTVFRGDAEWVRRLKAAAAGGLLGVALSLALPVSGHGTVWGAVIGLSCGVCIGLLSDSRPGSRRASPPRPARLIRPRNSLPRPRRCCSPPCSSAGCSDRRLPRASPAC
jgi:hypothetical protein